MIALERLVVEAVRDHFGAGDAGRDAVRADAARAVFAGHVLGQRLEAALGRRIGPAAPPADMGESGGDVDHRGPVAEVRQDFAAQPERRAQHDVIMVS